jgi:ElaB/YqjD/DUF883 family membrane-anchored ribosome-binding protein
MIMSTAKISRNDVKGVDDLRDELKQIRADFAELAQTLVAVTKSEATDARSRLQAEAEKRIGQIRDTVHAAKEKGADGLESMRHTVEERPIASVVGAFSVGMVIGLLLKGRS